LLTADLLAYHNHKNHVESAAGKTYDHSVWTALMDIKFAVDQEWDTDDLLHFQRYVILELEALIKANRI
jgi:hypothetical protein